MIKTLLSVLSESLGLVIGGEMVVQSLRRARATLLAYAMMALLGLAAAGFFYVLVFRLLADALGETIAAAILCGANLLLIGLVLLVRLARRSRRRSSANALLQAARRGSDIETALAIGLGLERRLKEHAFQAAVIAAVAGLAIGARPELLRILKSGEKPRAGKPRHAD